MRGDKSDSFLFHPFRLGSPPHTRGQVAFVVELMNQLGITPAYAGTRFPIALTAADPRDHPRIRGDKFEEVHIGFPYEGSPPHTRGQGAHRVCIC